MEKGGTEAVPVLLLVVVMITMNIHVNPVTIVSADDKEEIQSLTGLNMGK